MRRSNWNRHWDNTPEAAEYRAQYCKENYVAVSLRVRPDVRDFISGCADRLGLSKTELIVRAVQEYNARH